MTLVSDEPLGPIVPNEPEHHWYSQNSLRMLLSRQSVGSRLWLQYSAFTKLLTWKGPLTAPLCYIYNFMTY